MQSYTVRMGLSQEAHLWCLLRGRGGLELCQFALSKPPLVPVTYIQRPDTELVSRSYSTVTDLPICKLSTLFLQALSCSLRCKCMLIKVAVTLDDLSCVYLLTWSEGLSKEFTSINFFWELWGQALSGQDWRAAESPDAFVLVRLSPLDIFLWSILIQFLQVRTDCLISLWWMTKLSCSVNLSDQSVDQRLAPPCYPSRLEGARRHIRFRRMQHTERKVPPSGPLSAG